jgi:hypothetical protein
VKKVKKHVPLKQNIYFSTHYESAWNFSETCSWNLSKVECMSILGDQPFRIAKDDLDNLPRYWVLTGVKRARS